MENLSKVNNEVNRKFVNLEVWRTETEFRALTNFKGDLLNDAFQRISGQYHEKLHRIKLSIIKGGQNG